MPMKRSSKNPKIADVHINQKKYQLMYGNTNSQGTADFKLTSRTFLVANGPAPIYEKLVKIIQKYTFSLLGLSNEEEALGEIINIQRGIDNIDQAQKDLVEYSLRNFETEFTKSQNAFKKMKNSNQPVSMMLLENVKSLYTLKQINRLNGKELGIAQDEAMKLVESSAGRYKNNIQKFKAMQMDAKANQKTYSDVQNSVTGTISTTIGAINEIVMGSVYKSVLGVDGKNIKMTGLLTGSSNIDKKILQNIRYKGDFYEARGKNHIYTSLKWKTGGDKGGFKATDSLSLLQFQGSKFSQFMVDIINLRLSTKTTNQFNTFVAALLADIAFLGYVGRPLLFIKSTYKNNQPVVDIAFMYELFQYYLDTKLYPSTAKLDFEYSYTSLKDGNKYGYSSGYDFYNAVPMENIKDGDYMTIQYFLARVTSAAFTIKAKPIDFDRWRAKKAQVKSSNKKMK